jgi:hypothetical protein
MKRSVTFSQTWNKESCMLYSTFRPRRRPKAIVILCTAFLLTWTLGCDSDTTTAPPQLDQRSGEVIVAWNNIAYEALVAQDGYANPLTAVHMLAIMHIAQHDAINSVDSAFDRYIEGPRDAEADPVAAAARAAYEVLTVFLPAQRAALDAKLAASLATVPDGQAKTRGIALGTQAAAAILAARSTDGSDTPAVGDYIAGSGPGRYQFTPGWDFAFQPGWRNLKPFALTSAGQFRSPPPPALESQAYATAFNEVKSVGQKGSQVRAADQTAYAKFWYEFSDIGWNRIARVVATDKRLGLQSTARLFALLNMAMSDSYVSGWDSKYYYDFWRPVTAVRAALMDGNAATSPDSTWEPELRTPPVQDYPSTHSVLGNAAAEVLAAVFGEQTSFTFTSTSGEPASYARSFQRFSQAADENADSRVRAGLHFRFAIDAGQELGRKVGDWTVKNHLRRR